MKSVLHKYKMGLNELEKFIELQKIEKKLFSTIKKKEKEEQKEQKEQKEELYKSLEGLREFVSLYEGFSSKIVFDYNTIIISMYGYLEAFIEDLIKAYISTMRIYIRSFDNMPEKIKGNHSDLSALLIQNMKLPKYKDVTTVQNIIINMNSCVIRDESYQINLDAYTHHTSNFRKGSIDEFFSKIGIENISSLIQKHPKFKVYIEENDINIHNLFEIIDDLAERRNQVSHGSDGNVISSEILLGYLKYFYVYGEVLYSILNMEVIKYRIEKDNELIKLGDSIAIFGNDIVCFSIYKLCIKTGFDIYAKTNNDSEPIRYGKIISIRVNNRDVNEVQAENNDIEISLKVDFKVNKKYEYYMSRAN